MAGGAATHHCKVCRGAPHKDSCFIIQKECSKSCCLFPLLDELQKVEVSALLAPLLSSSCCSKVMR